MRNASVCGTTTLVATYAYDTSNRLIREDIPGTATYLWSYDRIGNIMWRKQYPYTPADTAVSGNATTCTYGYNASGWQDQLTAYGTMAISYDQIGNPLAYGDWVMAWEHGRQLASMERSGESWAFTYNADGLRTKRVRTQNGASTTWEYVYNGSQLVQMTKGSDTLYFAYDASGLPLTVTHGSTVYYYVTNLQGDVIGLLDSFGSSVASYTYDAWGNPLSSTGTQAGTIGALNPLRYRGYVYDSETGFYYLQSRYYDPQTGRFINADGLLSTGQDILGNNMFSYCLNNPVNSVDSAGLRAVANNRCLGGGISPYISDGIGRSDAVMEYFRDPESDLCSYPDFTMRVTSNGNCFKSTDHSLDYADYVLRHFLPVLCPIINPIVGIYEDVSEFLSINDVEIFPDGYYDTYTISVSWTDTYKWDGGATITHYSYDFVVCWDTVSTPNPCWQYYTAVDKSYSEIVYD